MHPFKPAHRGIPPRTAQRRYTRLFPGVYIDPAAPVTPLVKARAAWLWADGACVLTGISAAAVHGARWLPGEAPAEVAVGRVVRVRGLVAHRDRIHPRDITDRLGMRVTSPARTAFDLARRHEPDTAICHIDALCRATDLAPNALLDLAGALRATPGAARLRALAGLVDPGAESPRETVLRLLLLRAGLPRAVTQFVVRDARGRFIGRTDLAWPRWRVAIEYEGSHHFTDPEQARRDAERGNRLMRAGWRVVRVTAPMMQRPDLIIEEVRAALRAAGGC
ncbi:hypothetical protein HT102_06125 [Hoyosella sp. G463]|uniref:DUF559 domain-containing protein n=1 Tax=Lolliginicoccus lacisalsi TaxID=2742202 RepID=A0A927PKT0_9ACTN|nr:hypothetical protein [Lolliginicoccus lacisalsi]MBD8506058.1 hypothetical protein [Lolliginicoccus lacisalsi]